MKKSNLILIGMPGAGKSTVGVILAKRLGFNFIDTDLLIQAQQRNRLQEIIDTQGLEKFRQIEEQVLIDLSASRTIIATGGSVVYSEAGMAALQQTGHLIYLQEELDRLLQRIADMGQRGLVMAAGQSFEQLYQERTPRYEKYAELTIPCNELTAEEVAAQIETEVTNRVINQLSQTD
ncbi:MAG TPA: shikimate kinase [Malonomonas sp.]